MCKKLSGNSLIGSERSPSCSCKLLESSLCFLLLRTFLWVTLQPPLRVRVTGEGHFGLTGVRDLPLALLGSHEVTSPRSLLRSKSAQESGVLSLTWKVSLWGGSEAGLHLPHGICSCLSSAQASAGPSTSRVKNKSQREPADEQKFCWIAGSDHLVHRIWGVPEVFVLLLHPGTALCG